MVCDNPWVRILVLNEFIGNSHLINEARRARIVASDTELQAKNLENFAITTGIAGIELNIDYAQ
jgi:hypothetical protein